MLLLLPESPTIIPSTVQKYQMHPSIHPADIFRYAFVPLQPQKDGLHALCRILPSGEVNKAVCTADLTVLRYDSFSCLGRLFPSLSYKPIPLDPARVVVKREKITDMKTVQVSLVFKNLEKRWSRDHLDLLTSLVRDILMMFVLCGQCIIRVNQLTALGSNIEFIVISMKENKDLLFLVKSDTVVTIKHMISEKNLRTSVTKTNLQYAVGVEHAFTQLHALFRDHRDKMKQKHTKKINRMVLLAGPSGCGKKSILKGVANGHGFNSTIIYCTELIEMPESKVFDHIESIFRELKFLIRGEETMLLILDHVEKIFPKGGLKSWHGKKLRAWLYFFLENLDESECFIIVATTDSFSSVEPHFYLIIDVEVRIEMPDEVARVKIWKHFLNKYKIPSENLFTDIVVPAAAITQGYCGRDIELCVHQLASELPLGKKLENDNDIFEFLKATLAKIGRTMIKERKMHMLFDPNISLHDLGGMEVVKSKLISYVAWPLLHPEQFHGMGIQPPKGILLYGPPGCAKTSLASAVANMAKVPLFCVSAASLYSPYVGESERNVLDLFDQARLNEPCIIFVDEIDALVGSKDNTPSNSAQNKVLTTFLLEMDGVGVKTDKIEVKGNLRCTRVIVIGATTRPEALDAALRRPGRFDRQIFVGPPTVNERYDILQTIVRKYRIQVKDMEALKIVAKDTSYCTGADLKNLLREAGICALSDDVNCMEIKLEHLKKALKEVKPSLTKEALIKYTNYRDNILCCD